MNTTTLQKPALSQDIGEILGLNTMSHEEQSDFLNRVGELIIESAVLRYVVTLEPSERDAFTAWLETHQYDETLLQDACENYPDFAEILTEEMDAFQSEAKRMFGL